MDILIQSVCQKAKLLGTSVNIRFWKRNGQPMGKSWTEPAPQTTSEEKGCMGVTSHVIIRRPFEYLEPVVREIFEGAEDVQVILDRRWHERRQSAAADHPESRRKLPDRRASAPILDVLINMDPQ
jgi:hypothetical protein